MPHNLRRLWTFALFWLLMPFGAAGRAAPPDVDNAATAPSFDPADVEFFERQVRPLLVARCHACHGPEKHKGNLRLDSRAGVLRGGDTGAAVVAGKPDESLLVDAIRYGDTYQMPPKSQLPAEEIATLVDWVRRGLPWGREAAPEGTSTTKEFDLRARASHWSFQPLAAVSPPGVSNDGWIKTPIDRFVLAGINAASLQPAPPAEKLTLLRRVTFDLLGLPPSVADIEAFLADDSPTAYERVVERLLASPHYGERWARHWLDLVRYAETQGHEFDIDIPNAYRYRDYVIRAFNADLPYDQFVIEHVAGDLLNPPRRHPQEGFNESIIGTGFFFLGEAKHSPVDVRQDEADRVDNQIDVLAKTFLGLTVSCARCHDHKFDPISTKDYYALAGYLQSSRCQQAFIDTSETHSETIGELQRLRAERQRACVEFARSAIQPGLNRLSTFLVGDSDQQHGDAWRQYLKTASTQLDDPWHAWAVLSETKSQEEFRTRRRELITQLRATQHNNSAVVFADFHGPDYGDWTATGTAFGTSPAKPLEWTFVGPDAAHGRLIGASAAHSGQLSHRLRGVLRSPTFEIEQSKIFYRLYGNGGKLRLIVDGLQLIQDPIYGGLQIPINDEKPHWHAQDVSKWIGHRAYIELVDDGDGYLALAQVVFGEQAPVDANSNGLVVKMLDDEAIVSPTDLARAYQSLFSNVLATWLSEPMHPQDDARDRAAIIKWVLQQRMLVPSAEIARHEETLAKLAARQRELEARITAPQQALALADGTAENEHVFVRGSHKTLGEEVPRRFLEVLGGCKHEPPNKGSGRLELARQIVSPDNPLTARVIVNRIWRHHFGEGLVRSPDDFGHMGQPPTHPELLDYLAGEFIGHGWSMKHLHRLLVLSNAYQMSSRAQPQIDAIDPQNKLWHRMNVRRLEAEAIRDSILTVSGKIDLKLYGPSIMPYLSDSMTGRGRPKDSGPLDGDRRRSIYLSVRRNFLTPMFLAFDYPTPFTTIGRRSTSNVPAQALAMMNNPFVIGQSRAWAERVLQNQQSTPERVREMYLTAFGRPPDASEEKAALEFLSADGEAARSDDLQTWSELAHVLFTAKEFVFIR